MALLRGCGLGRDESLEVGFEVSKVHLTLRLSLPMDQDVKEEEKRWNYILVKKCFKGL